MSAQRQGCAATLNSRVSHGHSRKWKACSNELPCTARTPCDSRESGRNLHESETANQADTKLELFLGLIRQVSMDSRLIPQCPDRPLSIRVLHGERYTCYRYVKMLSHFISCLTTNDSTDLCHSSSTVHVQHRTLPRIYLSARSW